MNSTEDYNKFLKFLSEKEDMEVNDLELYDKMLKLRQDIVSSNEEIEKNEEEMPKVK